MKAIDNQRFLNLIQQGSEQVFSVIYVWAFVHQQLYLGAKTRERYVTCTLYKKGAISCANRNMYTGMSYNAKSQTCDIKLQ